MLKLGLPVALSCVLFLGLLGRVQAGEPAVRAELEEAMAQYDKGNFQGAADGFRSLLSKNPDQGHLYYNLGNSYFRLGQKGQAMAAYLEARRLLPRDPDIKANLKFTLDSVADRLDTDLGDSISTAMAFWVGHVTPRELAYLSAWLVAGAGAALLFSLWPPLQWASSVAGGLVSLGIVVGFAWTISLVQQPVWGAVTAPLAKVVSGPGQGNAVLFELKEGAPFVVRKAEGSWYQIELSDGKKGWVASADAAAFAEAMP